MNRIGLLLVLVLSCVATATPLTIAEMRKSAKVGDTVELQGTITVRGRWFVHIRDDSGAVVIYDTYREYFGRTGDVIRVSAKVENHHGTIIGRITAHEKVGEDFDSARPIVLPAEAFLNATDLESRAITLSGTVIDAFKDELDPEWTCLVLAPQTTPVTAMVFDPKETLGDLAALIGADIRVSGALSTEGQSRPYLGRFLITFFATDVSVRKPAPADPLDTEEMTYDEKASVYVARTDGRRYRVTGTVLATWDNRQFFIQTAAGPAIRVRTERGLDLPSVGDSITVSGFPAHTIFFAKLGNAVWRPAPETKFHAASPVDISPHELLQDHYNQPHLNFRMDGRPVRLKGRLVSVSDLGTSRHALYLDCGTDTVVAEAPQMSLPPIGSELELTGICRFTEDEGHGSLGIARLTGFSVLLRSANDIRVLQDPPWWTPARTAITVSLLVLLVLAGLVWNFILQKLVARKGRELARESLAHLKAELRTDERTSLAVELHDTIAQNLTGVSMQMEGVDEAHRIGSPRLGELIGKARHALDSCRTELRNCLWDLRNDAFDSDDISATVRKAIAPHLGSASAGVKLGLQRSHISDSTFHAILCIIRELVINAVRHGAATQIDIRGEMTETALKITVRDNGRGFDPNDRPGPAEGHFGLLGIQERLDRLGGTLGISSTPGHGAEFTIILES